MTPANSHSPTHLADSGFAGDAAAREPSPPPTRIGFELRANLIITPVRVNGVEQRFVLDTGASQTVLDRSAALALGLRDADRATARGAGGDVTTGLAAVRSLSVGDADVHDLTCLTSDLGGISERLGGGIGGVLGFDVLSKFELTIDYRGALLTLRRYPQAASGPKRVDGDNFHDPASGLTLRRPDAGWSFELDTPLPGIVVQLRSAALQASVRAERQELHGLTLAQIDPAMPASLAGEYEDFQFESAGDAVIAGAAARAYEFLGRRDGDAGRFRVYLFKPDCFLWSISCFAPTTAFATAADAFDGIARGVKLATSDVTAGLQ